MRGAAGAQGTAWSLGTQPASTAVISAFEHSLGEGEGEGEGGEKGPCRDVVAEHCCSTNYGS